MFRVKQLGFSLRRSCRVEALAATVPTSRGAIRVACPTTCVPNATVPPSPDSFSVATRPSRRCITSDSTSAAAAADSQILMEHHFHADNPNAIVTTLTLNRPKANAMGSTMLQELQDCLAQLESNNQNNNTRCLVVTSFSPKVFSAGADLKERATMTQDEAAAFVTQLRNTMERLSQLPIPVVAAVDGVAVGGGLELALAADIRVASVSATFGLPETSLAIIPGAGGTQRLPRLLGSVARAKELIWTGRRITAQEALDYGLVQHVVVENGKALDKAMELAWQIAKNGPVAIQASKQAIQEGMKATDMTEALEIERQNYAKVLPTEDRLEGLAAFKEGRAPAYKGQ